MRATAPRENVLFFAVVVVCLFVSVCWYTVLLPASANCLPLPLPLPVHVPACLPKARVPNPTDRAPPIIVIIIIIARSIARSPMPRAKGLRAKPLHNALEAGACVKPREKTTHFGWEMVVVLKRERWS